MKFNLGLLVWLPGSAVCLKQFLLLWENLEMTKKLSICMCENFLLFEKGKLFAICLAFCNVYLLHLSILTDKHCRKVSKQQKVSIQNVKKKSHFQINFCYHFKFCHNRRNSFCSTQIQLTSQCQGMI